MTGGWGLAYSDYMRFVFDERKTAHAATWLLRHRGSMPYMKLIKLLYLADRQSLIETGYPLTGDKHFSMDRGPVLSAVLDAIHYGSEVWNQYVSGPTGYDVSLALTEETALYDLSEYDIEVLTHIDETFGHLDQWALVDYTHTLPEWEDPSGGAIPIDTRVVLQSAGMSDHEIHEIASQVDAVWTFRNLYATAR